MQRYRMRYDDLVSVDDGTGAPDGEYYLVADVRADRERVAAGSASPSTPNSNAG